MARKKIHSNAIKGQRGINLIEEIVLAMGCVWYATGQLEAGIDGYIEIRDPVSGEVTNSIIQVQSKATDRPFAAETATSFEYTCDEKDLDYWLAGNAPVILVVSRPQTREAYWVAVKSYFADAGRRAARKVVFDKAQQRFDVSCRQVLINLAMPRDAGLYLAPQPKQEKLCSNLLPVTYYSERLFVADTAYRQAWELREVATARGLNIGGAWILHDTRIYSLYDLRLPPWDTLCDRGTVDDFATEEWATSADPAIRRHFVDLLNRCLTEIGQTLELVYDRRRKHYYFRATPDLAPRIVRYQSAQNQVTRAVFEAYRSKSQPDQVAYYRHSAFEGRFRSYGGEWYLEITPTYHFTWDGYHPDRYAKDRLATIKRLERNGAVLGQLFMWASQLRQQPSLFTARQPLIHFGGLVQLELGAGIVDDGWRTEEESDEAQMLADPVNDGLWGDV